MFVWIGSAGRFGLGWAITKLWLAFQSGDAAFVTLNDLEKCHACIPQSADLPRVFGNLPGLFLTFAQKKFDGLGQRFMPLG
jgi:hypothetical protein